jgi:ubiquinone/menaquinone biosynthesis C-methylase UbiE
MTTLEHPQGKVLIQELSNGKRRLEVSVSDQNTFVSSSKWETSYPVELIQRIMEIKSPAYLCDEIRREEDSNYIAHHIETTLFAHIAPEAFVGKRLLDFGCGSGASTVILARLLPHTEIVGIELNPLHLEIAHLRANHYRLENVDFYQSQEKVIGSWKQFCYSPRGLQAPPQRRRALTLGSLGYCHDETPCWFRSKHIR